MYLSKITIGLTFIVSLNAAALNIRSPSLERRATQSCHATDHSIFASYSVWIGVPYDSGNCDTAYHYLEYGDGSTIFDGCAISSWKCVKASQGQTQLYFNAPKGEAACINPALEEAYPSVGEFNCPDQ